MFNKSVILALVSTITQYYNYALFGISASILSKHFISDSDAGLVKFFSIFALGVLAKPLGSLMFGMIGDNYGRSVAMKLSALTITMSSTIIYLASYYVGSYGIFFLMLSRILLVVSVAGESDGVRIYLTEMFAKKNQYLTNGLIIASTQIGVLLAFAVSYAVEIYDATFKISFLIGSILGLCVLIFRSYFIETEYFLNRKNKKYVSIGHALNQIITHKKSFALSVILFGAMGGIYQFHIIFMNSYLRLIHLGEPHFISMIHITGIMIFGVSAVVSGYVADRYQFGFKQIYVALLGLFFTSILNCVCMYFGILNVPLFIASIALIPVYIVIIEIYIRNNTPTETLYTIYSVSHSVGSVILSGTTPLICTLLWRNTELSYAPYVYLLFLILCITFCIKIFTSMLSASKTK